MHRTDGEAQGARQINGERLCIRLERFAFRLQIKRNKQVSTR